MPCRILQELNTQFRIAKLRYSRFMGSLRGTVARWADKEEVERLEFQISETQSALIRHQQQHGCTG